MLSKMARLSPQLQSGCMVFQVIGKLGQFLVHTFDLIDAQTPRNAVMRATGALFFKACS